MLIYSLMRLIYYTTFRITSLALSAETETWLISRQLYQKCAFTALELRETILKLTDKFSFYIFKLAVLALFLSAKLQKYFISGEVNQANLNLTKRILHVMEHPFMGVV